MEKLPIEKNETYEIEITDLGTEGEGIGRVRGFTVFVPGGLPGEKLLIRIIKIKKSFAYGKLLEILTASPSRIAPPCPYYKTCGGCSIMHLDYPAQLEFKAKRIKDSLERIGGFKDINVQVIGMDKPFYYRNKAQFPVSAEDGNIKIGFFSPRSHRVTDIKSCLIHHEKNDEILKTVRDFIKKTNLSIYDEATHTGLLRHILTKVSFATGEIMVCLVINGRSLPLSGELAKGLAEIPGMASVSININTQRTNVILGRETKLLWGQKYITEALGDIKYKISPRSFFQVNPVQAKVICETSLEMARLRPTDTVLELYCGTGTLSLWFARAAGKVFGVDIVPEAISDATDNARENGIENAEFLTASAEEAAPMLLEKGFRPDAVLIDPPRKGCSPEVLDAIIKMSPQKLIYVSCNPATLARDLRILCDRGFELRGLKGVDQFCHTGHVETVVLMSRVKD